jgi:hypothetical protein
MAHLIVELIARRARLDHGGDAIAANRSSGCNGLHKRPGSVFVLLYDDRQSPLVLHSSAAVPPGLVDRNDFAVNQSLGRQIFAGTDNLG